MMKKLGRKLVVAILGRQVRRLCATNPVKVIGVTGSIGKTSTKLAIAQVLAAGMRVRYQEGNYNDLATVPLVFFGEKLPALTNPLAWLKLFKRNKQQLKKIYPYDAVVVELGSDAPGQIIQFKRYLKLDIAVVTAITPEHMEFFDGMSSVAREELSVKEFSERVLINKDLCDGKYIQDAAGALTYGIEKKADYNAKTFGIAAPSVAETYSALAAAAVATELGLTTDKIKPAVAALRPFAGRMRRLAGVNNSTIIDDSYNASPAAMQLALDTLYALPATQKIALLGNMNELGDFSRAAHQDIGQYCDPKQLDMVVTIGPDANTYLAPAASAAGCKVHSFDSPYDAGEFLKPVIKKGGLILIKGSQNKVFAEEAIKNLLADPADTAKLVRQSDEWMQIKRKAFNR